MEEGEICNVLFNLVYLKLFFGTREMALWVRPFYLQAGGAEFKYLVPT